LEKKKKKTRGSEEEKEREKKKIGLPPFFFRQGKKGKALRKEVMRRGIEKKGARRGLNFSRPLLVHGPPRKEGKKKKKKSANFARRGAVSKRPMLREKKRRIG